VLDTASRIEASAVDMETGMRGYLLAGKKDFLSPYQNGSTQFDELLGELSATVSDNPAQVAYLKIFHQLFHNGKVMLPSR
jgi:methyl-accepting chemotaxis protein